MNSGVVYSNNIVKIGNSWFTSNSVPLGTITVLHAQNGEAFLKIESTTIERTVGSAIHILVENILSTLPAVIDKCTIDSNTVSFGAGLFAFGAVNATISDTVFSNNRASKGAAVFAAQGSAVHAKASASFRNNTARVAGGGFFFQVPEVFPGNELFDCVGCTGNSAPYGSSFATGVVTCPACICSIFVLSLGAFGVPLKENS